MAERYEQLPLSLRLADDATFANFYVAEANSLPVSELERQAQGEGAQWIFLVGAAGSGRSHLLQACCHRADESGRHSRYLPVADLLEYPPEALLEGVETLDLLCLDDIDRALGRGDWERALFNCYNRCLASGTALLLAAAQPVTQLPCDLADLASRLAGFSVYRLRVLNEQERLQALRFRARCLGLEMGADVAAYIYTRCERDIRSLFAVLDRLDRASLVWKRRVTIPFVKRVMGW